MQNDKTLEYKAAKAMAKKDHVVKVVPEERERRRGRDGMNSKPK